MGEVIGDMSSCSNSITELINDSNLLFPYLSNEIIWQDF